MSLAVAGAAATAYVVVYFAVAAAAVVLATFGGATGTAVRFVSDLLLVLSMPAGLLDLHAGGIPLWQIAGINALTWFTIAFCLATAARWLRRSSAAIRAH